MPHITQARAAAEYLLEQLRPHCERIEIAGSIRRQKDFVKDIEIVAIGARGTEPVPGSLFEERECDRLASWLDAIVAAGRHHAIIRPKVHAGRTAPWGPKYKKLWVTHQDVTFPVDLFLATRDNWGPLMVIRTGPAEFSHRLVTPQEQGGAMPRGMRQHEGRLQQRVAVLDDDGDPTLEDGWEPVETPDEETYFACLGCPCWAPHQRTEKTLTDHLASRGIVRAAPSNYQRSHVRRSPGYTPFRTEARGPCSSSH
jgi:hypothetical protein